MKKVLITGAGSYIGTSFEKYVGKYYCSEFEIDTIDMRDGRWRSYDFRPYHVVLHVAGIAHADVGKADAAVRAKYYAVNTELAVKTAEKARASGVQQFVFLSSAIIYGNSAPYGVQRRITADTKPSPSNFYGDSKWQADKAVRKLGGENFVVTVLRPPMIYGKAGKGNYALLSKLAKKLPVFPDIKNERSVLYIENLCEFLAQVMMRKAGGIFWPQNAEYASTTDLVKMIAEVNGHRIAVSGIWNWPVLLASHIPGKIGELTGKAFGSLSYDPVMSEYDFNYIVADMRTSVERTEGKMKRILFLVNHDVVIYNFRLEIVERFIADGYEVHIASPGGDRIDDLVRLGAVWHEISIDRHGMNPVCELHVFYAFRHLLREIRPDLALGFTIKPNIYGAIACRRLHIPFVANITGLGTAVENGGWKQKLTVSLYRFAFGTKRGKIQRVFFQNRENERFFKNAGIAVNVHALLPGSGVSLVRYPYRDYPKDKTDGTVRFAFVSRIMKEKGIDLYLDTAREIKRKYGNVEFHVCGFCEPEYDGRLKKEQRQNTVIYHGMIRNVAEFIAEMHCIVHPTYYPEGISNVLLEACACGRPIITTDRAGCREVVEDGVNGYMIPCRDRSALTDAVERFLKLSWSEKMTMGKNGRKKVEREFDRQIVVEKYVEEAAITCEL